MEDLGTLLGYKVSNIQSKEDCEYVLAHAPKVISHLMFDTETDSPIDMSKRTEDNINIRHDMPFLLQFGWNHEVYLIDFRDFDDYVAIFGMFEELTQRARMNWAHNAKFDINMLMNINYVWITHNIYDTQTLIRLTVESKSEREGGMPLALKPIAARMLGTQYATLGHEVEDALKVLWRNKLNELMRLLKPYKISRRVIADTLKDPTSAIDEFPAEIQKIWTDWNETSFVRYNDVPKDIMHKYGACDVIIGLELINLLLPLVADKNQLEILKRDPRLLLALVRMERTGWEVDKKYLIECKQALIFEINAMKNINKKILGKHIAPGQHQAIKDELKAKFGYELTTTDKNQVHILIETDKSMPDEVKKYLRNNAYLRTLYKWISTYINPMLYKLNHTHDTKVYTQFNPNGTVSGRFTSNFQQFPKEPIKSHLGDFELFHPRRMFIVNPAYPEIACIDYSQVELRLQAEYTYYATKGFGDINMLRAYMPFKCHQVDDKWYQDEDGKEWMGIDLHTQSTHEAFPEVEMGTPEFKKLRSIGKRVNFALIYGASLRKVQETLADTDPSIVAKLYYGFHSKFKDVKTYGNWVTRNWVNNKGYVTNLLGRRYYLNDSKDVYKLNNYLIQGSAADILKAVTVRVDNYLRKNGYKTRLQGMVHDEFIICVAEGEHDIIYKIKEIMEKTVKTYVPLVAEISVTNTCWAEKKGV